MGIDVDERINGLATDFFAAGVVKIDTAKGFSLKLHEKNPTAPKSPIYLNIRTPDNPKPGPLTQEMVDKLGRLLCRYAQMQMLTFDAVAGLPNAGTPIAEAFVRAVAQTGRIVPHILLGKKITPEGRSVSAILDNAGVPRGKRVLIIDDLITEGHTKNEAFQELILNGGYIVRDVLVVVDRGQGGAEYLAELNIKLHYLLTLSEIIDLLLEKELITDADADKVRRYLGDASLHG